MYAGLGGGHLVCVAVRTGDPIWRFPMATGGVNSSALLYGDSVSWNTASGSTEPKGLSAISHSITVPRLHVLDPEGEAMRRLNVASDLARLYKSMDEDANKKSGG